MMKHRNGTHASDQDASARPPLLEQMADGRRNAIELATDNNWTLSQIAMWMAHPGNRATLSQLAALEDARARLLISRYRASAAMQLAAIACRAEPNDLARKACMDLLQVGLPIDVGDHTTGDGRAAKRGKGRAAARPVPSTQAILHTLEAMGRGLDATQGQVPQKGHDSREQVPVQARGQAS